MLEVTGPHGLLGYSLWFTVSQPPVSVIPPLTYTTVCPRGCSHARPRACACSRPGQDIAYAAQRMGVYLTFLRQVAGKDWLRAQ